MPPRVIQDSDAESDVDVDVDGELGLRVGGGDALCGTAAGTSNGAGGAGIVDVDVECGSVPGAGVVDGIGDVGVGVGVGGQLLAAPEDTHGTATATAAGYADANGDGDGGVVDERDRERERRREEDPTLTVNFDQFLASQQGSQGEGRGRSGGGGGESMMTPSQERRERMWLGLGLGEGERGLGMGMGMRLKRGRSAGGVGMGMGMALKRRRTVGGFVDGDGGGWEGEDVGIGSLGGGGGGEGDGEDVAFADGGMIFAAQGERDQGHEQEGYTEAAHGAIETIANSHGDAYAETSTMPKHTETPDLGAPPPRNHPPPSRSKSALSFDYSPSCDTEPMSSTTLVRARRTMSTFAGNPPQSSNEGGDDELALPPTVQVAITNMKPTQAQARKSTITEMEPEDDQDELDSMEFIGMPRECYKPRPSRSRSRRIVDDGVGNGDIHDDVQLGVEVAVIANNSPLEQALPNGPTPHIPEQAQAQLEQAPSAAVPAATPAEPADIILDPPKRAARRGPKKKVKRGKTTSVMMKRAIESDVEDDVIWVEERPADVTFKETVTGKKKSAKTKREEEDVFKSENEMRVKLEVVNAGKSEAKGQSGKLEDIIEQQPGPVAPAPKKRGRKRKKTTDSLIAEAQMATASETEIGKKVDEDQDSKTIQPLTEQDQNILPIPNHDHSENPNTNTNTPASPTTAKNNPTNPEQNFPQTENNPPSPKAELQPTTTTTASPTSTPQKPPPPPPQHQKGPDKHSPITINKKISYRVGLSRTARIAPLLKVVRKP
ncbi:hypothetical protein FQN55_002606 [Onygenales sp. PD_40]|nr:hypothetical protein FQN55_002606 [Onygenales sp. PD_40]